ncbi:ABC transporter substrate-binding protein [Flavobacteriaceae bacterium]|nr:ABC transporter substrate-binding protein [Flavobacteriaceae bacterium]
MKIFKILFLLIILIFTASCDFKEDYDEINIGCILPLKNYTVILGTETKNTLTLAVEQYNANRNKSEPKINLFFENGNWGKDESLYIKKYKKLKVEHDIDVLFISNYVGTLALNRETEKDEVIIINPYLNDDDYTTLNRDIFKLGVTIEDSNNVISERILERKLKNIKIICRDNIYNRNSALAIKNFLDEELVLSHIEMIDENKLNIPATIDDFENSNNEAMVLLGGMEMYKLLNECRKKGIKEPFFLGNNLPHERAKDTTAFVNLGDVEFTFFTSFDGNYILANKFFIDYKKRFGKDATFTWVNMQAYDAMNLTINSLKDVNKAKVDEGELNNWMRKNLFSTRYYQGICGNLSISERGAVKGIHFSVYTINPKGKIIKVRRD